MFVLACVIYPDLIVLSNQLAGYRIASSYQSFTTPLILTILDLHFLPDLPPGSMIRYFLI